MMPQKLSNLIANGPSLVSKISNPSYADPTDKNLHGVKPYGLTEADLDKEPFDSKSASECEEEAADFKEAVARGEDPPASMCVMDEAVGNALSCMESESEDCARVGEAAGEQDSSIDFGSSGDLPDGSEKELAKEILDSDKVVLSGNAKTNITSTSQTDVLIDKKLLQLIIGAAKAGIKISS